MCVHLCVCVFSGGKRDGFSKGSEPMCSSNYGNRTLRTTGKKYGSGGGGGGGNDRETEGIIEERGGRLYLMISNDVNLCLTEKNGN